MIVAWMLYSILLGSLALLAALAADRLLGMWHGARRFAWLAALTAATLVPIGLAMRRQPFATLAPSVSTTVQDIVSATSVVDPIALAGWIIASAFALALYAGATIRIRRRERGWRVAELDGEPVLVASDLGPAVIGILAPRVVVPSWAFELDTRSRRFMMRHEDEHIRAGDPQLLFAAALALMLFPWNPALWLIVGRLRLAIEVDCDARVLLDGDEGGLYGALLLAVCARRGTSPALSAAFAEHTPHIERRIIAMTESQPRSALLSSMALAAIAIAAIALAIRVPHPASLRPWTKYSNGVLALPGVRVNAYLPREQTHTVILDTTVAGRRAATSKASSR